MKTRLLAGTLGFCLLLLAPLNAADTVKRKPQNQTQDSDMQRAIAFERYKDLAAARQARKEARHPTVFYNEADRPAHDTSDRSNKVTPKNPTGK